jgi:hypothetical protein
LNNIVCIFINFFDFREKGELVFETWSNICVHVSNKEDIIVIENGLSLLNTHFFDLKSVFMYFFDIFDPVLLILSAFLQLTPNKDKLAVVNIKPYQIGALV